MDATQAGFEPEDATDGVGMVTFTRLDAADACVLEVRGDLDIAVSGALGRALDDLLDTERERVGVDLSGVPFMDSSALSALVRAHERAKAGGQHLELLQPSPACAKVLGITGLDRVFEVR
jgi:anti-sigma B factor antagonist